MLQTGHTPDLTISPQSVAFGTSGHRGSAFEISFNEGYMLAITQVICDYRKCKGLSGSLFLGIDTHALSEPACASALEVLAANGLSFYARVEAAATSEQKQRLAKLSQQQVLSAELAGEKKQSKFTHATGNNSSIGRLKVIGESGWFAARPSGTADIYKIYAESFRGENHLRHILEEAQTMAGVAMAAPTQ